ncbi:MAG: phosphoglucomutase/phosphomannomutase family protein [Elusimicrobiota bacterium]
MGTKIEFGTDGWRAIIAEDFTFANVKRVAAAAANYLTTKVKKNPVVTVGYDTRFHSRQFAETVAEVLAKQGCSVIINDTFMSTPALSYSVKLKKADGGVMISASHNPPEFNGFKFKTSDACSAPETVTKQFEEYANSDRTDLPVPGGSITKEKMTPHYLKYLKSYIDFKAIKNKTTKVVIDPMHGAGCGYIAEILKGTKIRQTTIHPNPDPLFGGLHPEPIEQYLSDLKVSVRQNSAAIGLASDGDADRIGVVDDKGRYLPPHHVFPLLLYYLCHYKKMKGKVVQTISLGYLSERIAKDYNLPWEETPVGFKYIADRIMKEDVLIGGEESGGYGFGNYLPERDGILNSLMFIEMTAKTGKPVSAILDEIQKRYGKSVFFRTDFVNPGIPKAELVSKLKSTAPSSINGLKVKEIKDYDGIEFVLEDDSWLLLRPSGTEPKIRVYSETESAAKTKALLTWGDKAVKSLL